MMLMEATHCMKGKTSVQTSANAKGDLILLSLKNLHGLSKATLSCSSQLHVRPQCKGVCHWWQHIWRSLAPPDHRIFFFPQLIKGQDKFTDVNTAAGKEENRNRKPKPVKVQEVKREFLPMRLPSSKYCFSCFSGSILHPFPKGTANLSGIALAQEGVIICFAIIKNAMPQIVLPITPLFIQEARSELFEMIQVFDVFYKKHFDFSKRKKCITSRLPSLSSVGMLLQTVCFCLYLVAVHQRY